MARVLLILPARTYRAHDFIEAAWRLGLDITVASEFPQAFASVFPGGFLRLDLHKPRWAARAIEEICQILPAGRHCGG